MRRGRDRGIDYDVPFERPDWLPVGALIAMLTRLRHENEPLVRTARRVLIADALAMSGGHATRAAGLIGVSRRVMSYWVGRVRGPRRRTGATSDERVQ